MPILRYTYALRIFYFLLITFAALMVAAVAMTAIMGGGMSTMTLRLATVAQDVLLFIVPAIVTACVVSPIPARLLCIDRVPDVKSVLVAVAALAFAMPAMNVLVEWNESMTLPESLAGVEAWMRQTETAAQEQVALMLGGTSVADLMVSMLIIAVLAGVSEELFFRGAMQRLFMSGRMNHHAAIWLTAFLFSLFHMQFFGFFPRLMLGAFFGYLLYWSGSVWLPALIHVVNNASVVYVMWKSQASPDSGADVINTLGIDSAWMVVASIVLTAAAIYLLKNISENRNSVTC